MSMWDRYEKTVTARQLRSDLAPSQVAGQCALGEAILCCNEPMEPRLARGRDCHGETLFVAVWHCRRCGRTRC